MSAKSVLYVWVCCNIQIVESLNETFISQKWLHIRQTNNFHTTKNMEIIFRLKWNCNLFPLIFSLDDLFYSFQMKRKYEWSKNWFQNITLSFIFLKTKNDDICLNAKIKHTHGIINKNRQTIF